MPKVFKKERANRGPGSNPSKPLATAARELFCQNIAKGMKAPDAYRQAGYGGGDIARRQLRTAPDIANRIAHLMQVRIDADNAYRHKREKHPTDIKDFITSRLKAIASQDIRDLVQWKTIPRLDDEGAIILKPDGSPETETVMIVTPSDKLTADQAATIRRMGKKNGELNIEAHDPLVALDKLIRMEGLFQTEGPSSVSNTTINQLNVGQQPAGEAIRRLAFALQRLQHSQPLIDVTPSSHAPDDVLKE